MKERVTERRIDRFDTRTTALGGSLDNDAPILINSNNSFFFNPMEPFRALSNSSRLKLGRFNNV